MLLFLGLFVGYWLTLVGLERVAPKFVYKWIGTKNNSTERL
jgi:hypothetical protein